MDAVTLRDATDADIPALVGVLQQAFAEQATLDPPSGAISETDDKLRAVTDSGARAIVAEVGGAIVGCVFYDVETDALAQERAPHRADARDAATVGTAALYLFRLAVLPQYRERGVARALMTRGEQIARDLRLPRMRIGVRLALTRQRAWYERLGYRYVAFGTHAGYTQPTSATLEKPLH